ncbi:MAG: deoxyribodipyrimidine photo-lyase [Acidobacteriota bacterium]|nr:deoxyribodipyrimidine photo-lyase [Acidobacteriota bacterium]
MIQSERLKALNDKDFRGGDYVLYWMQASQRSECNHALEYAARHADELKLPLVAFFGLTPRYPGANERHYAFLLEGLADARAHLEAKGIQLVVRIESPERGAAEMAERAALAVVDRGYTRLQRTWRARAAEAMDCLLIQIESDAVVPVETASSKEEWSAATFRPKMRARRESFLHPLRERKPRRDSLGLSFDSLNLTDIDAVLAELPIDRSVKRSRFFPGGQSEAKSRLRRFLKDKLDHFGELRNIPTLDAQSHLGPYLHFGQISPLQAARQAIEAGGPGVEPFLEELLVRRELSLNFVHANPHYDEWEAVPAWARATLAEHAADPRPAEYSPRELEEARTHDPYWNAAQDEMRITGKMHGYMRMYWGKKILEWSRSPEAAFRTALALNDKYELDGRDPNSFAGVAWCFGKHDRPWPSRPVFGTVRSMNEAGLRRKFDADQYARMIDRLRSKPS